MARSAAIPLGFGAIGAIMLISGIQNESIGEVLKGEFGKGTKHETPNPSEAELTGTHGEGVSSTISRGSIGSSEAQGGFAAAEPGTAAQGATPGSRLAPNPRAAGATAGISLETQAIYNILVSRHINPAKVTNKQLNEAREQYAREQEFLKGSRRLMTA